MGKTIIPISLQFHEEVVFIDNDPFSPLYNTPYMNGTYKTGDVIYVRRTDTHLYYDSDGRWNFLPKSFLIYVGLMTLDERWQ